MLEAYRSCRFGKPHPLGRSLLRYDADVEASRSRKVLTGEISFARLARTAAESLAVLTDKEVDDVLIAVVSIGHAVLPEDGCKLDEKV